VKTMKWRRKLATLLDDLLDFLDIRRHYRADYLFFDTLLQKPMDFDYLLQVPSQTSVRERLFLYNYFRLNWQGGKVLEIGPFVGGTTRSIAMGMLDSKFRSLAEKKFLTIDEFDNYTSGEVFYAMGVPKETILKSGELSASSRIPFKQIFDFYTENQPYSDFIEALTMKIPEFESQTVDSDALLKLHQFSTRDSSLECVFIDGAKSYYATYFILENLAESINVGTRLIFQDYLKVSCWWIPLVMGSLNQFFKVESIIDSTVSFVCIKPLLNKSTIIDILPVTTQEFSEARINSAFNSEAAQEVSGYSKKTRAMTLNQERAALVDSGKRLGWATFEEFKVVWRLFPRSLGYVSTQKKATQGIYNQK